MFVNLKPQLHAFLIALVLFVTAITNLAAATTATVSGTTQGAITSAISSACNGTNAGMVVFPDGTYTVNSAISIPSNCALQAQNQGQAILHANQNQIFYIDSSGVTINGLILDGGWVAFGFAYTYSNFVFTNNTIQNLTTAGAGGGPTALSAPGLISSTISNNQFKNIWGGGGYPAAPTSAFCQGSINVDCWGSAAITLDGMDLTTISNNTFDQIGNDGMHIDWLVFTGYSGPSRSTSGNVISYNTFSHVRRIPMELQSQPSPNCPGGCNYGITNTVGLQVKGNYAHDYAFPYYDTWGASLVPDGNVGGQFINNTFLANPGDQNGYAAGSEISSRNGIVQGNVIASVPGSAKFFGGGFAQGNGSNSTFTETYQNNVLCGNYQTTIINVENPQTPSRSSVLIDRYNYKDGSNCPAGTNLTTSSISTGFTSSDQQAFTSGGSGTWSLYVVSNLSIKYVQFFIDGSTKSAVTQEIQDVNTNFASDRRWLYHATLDTSTLTAGAHTILAVATDVSGATQSATQTFQTGSGSAPGIPLASLAPSTLSLGSQLLNTSTGAANVTLTNSGTAPLTITGIQIDGSNASDFTDSSGCGSTLAVATSCTIQVIFTPSAAGPRSAALSVASNASGSSQGVSLTGTGLPPVTTPPPGNPDPPVTPVGNLPTNLPTGMVLWLANDAGLTANGTAVSAWDDQSGNGNSAVQPTAANRPSVVSGNNGEMAVRFNGTSSFLSIAGLPIDGINGMSVFLVSSSAKDPSVLGYGIGALLYWPETTSWGSTFFGAYQTSVHFRFGTTQIGNENSLNMPFTRTSSFGLSEWVHSRTADSMWLNGQGLGSFGGKVPQINGVGSTAILGMGMSNSFYSGDVSEVLVYSRSLTTAERVKIEQYLMNKYHL